MYKILVVDDDKVPHSFIAKALSGSFFLVDAYSGEEALKLLNEEKPDLILLDVEMPGINGYEVCEQIKSNQKTAQIPIIFLSANETLQSQMQGFEAGADDYIVKPFQTETLLAKIRVCINYLENSKQLSTRAAEAETTAMSAIASSSDWGQSIQFIEKSHNVSSVEQLVENFFAVTRNMGLKCSLLIQTNDEPLFFTSSPGQVSPLESKLMEKLVSHNRFFDFDCRTQINYPYISLLVKNMPLDNMEHYGRIKDMLPALLSTSDIKINQINTLSALSEQTKEADNLFVSVTQELEGIIRTQKSQNAQGIQLLRNMLLELDQRLPHMGLEEDQEQYLLDRVDVAIAEAHDTISSTKQTQESFQLIINQLKTLVESQQTVHDQLFQTVENPAEESDDQEGYEMDVVLF